MKYLILGGGGSFGLHIAKYLLEQSETTRVLSIGRSFKKPPCFSMGIGDYDHRYSYMKMHVAYDYKSLLMVLNLEKPDIIINFAAQGEGATSFTESWRYFETNCVGLSRLVEALIGKDWLKRFIHVGSSEVYGSQRESPADEKFGIHCTSPYAISKAAFDNYLCVIGNKFNFPAVIVRPSNCYGEGQQLHRFIPKAFLYGLTGRKMPLHGGGKAEKSYIHTQDLARAIYLLKDAPRGVYNVGPPNPTAMVAVADMVAVELGMNDVSSLCEVTEDRAHQDSRYWLDSSKIRALGWEPKIAWGDGLKRMHKWVADNLDELRQQPVEFVMRP